MEKIKKLLLENKAWAQGHLQMDPEYFENMAKDQNPDILWIGCADSRVPPDEILNCKPGSLFVHRNIANIVHNDDENLLSVLEYAVKYLKVKYIIVCGHYNCGGVKAAFDGIDNPRLARWTKTVTDLKFEKAPSDFNQLVELSVAKQVEKLKEVQVIKDAWQEGGRYPLLLGWVYDIKTGLLKEFAKHIPNQ
jgi:carbonic anhydrase